MVKHFYSRFLMIVMLLCCTVWGSAAYAAIGEISKIYDDFKASGAFSKELVDVDWEKYAFEVTIDATGCGEDDDLLSFGTNLSDRKQFHLVYKGNNVVKAYINNASISTITLDNSKFTFRVDKKNGGYIDGKAIGIISGTSISNLDFIFNATETVKFGTADITNLGPFTDRVYEMFPGTAYYSNIQYVQIAAGDNDPKDAGITTKTPQTGSIVNKVYQEGYNFNYSKHIETTSIDWSKQKIVMSYDLSACKKSNENILSLGKSTDQWNGGSKAHWQFYYTKSSQQLELVYFDDSQKIKSHKKISVSGTNLTIEFSKSKGLKINDSYYNVNGDAVNGSDNGNVSDDELATYYADLWNMTEIEIGSNQGDMPTYAVANYINVVTNDYAPATSTSGNTLSQTTVNSFSSQENVNIKLDRTLSNEWWNTFCVPFDIDAKLVNDKFGEGTQIRTFESAQDGVINFTPVDKIEAGIPCLIKPANTVSNPTFSGVTLVAPGTDDGNPAAVMNGEYGMQGTYGYTEIKSDKTNLFLGEGDRFFYPDGSEGSNIMYGMRAFFIVPSGINTFALKARIDGETTSIAAIDGADKQLADAPVYNLQGQRVGNTLRGLRPGIYVQNGKKVVVK